MEPDKKDPLKALTPELKGARHQAMLDGKLAEFDRRHGLKGAPAEKETVRDIEEKAETHSPTRPEPGLVEEIERQTMLIGDARKAQEIAQRFMSKKPEDPDADKAA